MPAGQQIFTTPRRKGEIARRAGVPSSAGGHNLLMSGPPGAGKSLMAACLPGILPDLTPAEALEVSMIASVAGGLESGRLVRARPFRAPHHSASMPALVGGGLRVRPGEVSMAHLGVLFLDELPEFQRAVLDSLRQPLESGKVDVARANAHVSYPARVQLVAAMNPCRCGHLGDPSHSEVQEAMQTVFARAKTHGKPVGILAPAEADARRYIEMGASFVAVGSDLGVFRGATQALRDKYR